MNKLDILSTLLEGTMITDKTGKTTYVSNDVNTNAIRNDQNVKSAATTQGTKLKEEEIDEMARIPSKYKLADDWRAKLGEMPEKAQNSKTVKFILDYAGEHPEWQILDIAKAYGEMKGDPKFGRQQMFNPVVKDILEPYGVIVPTSGDALTKPRNSFAGEEDSVERDLEDRDAASDRDLGQYFNVSKGKDKDEFDEPDEIEPDLPKATGTYQKPSTSSAKAAEFFYDNDRLLQKMINVMMDARNKVRRANVSELEIKDDRFYKDEKNRVEHAKSKIDVLIDEYVAKIKEQDPEVQQAIIDMLESKLHGMLNLYNKIVKAVGVIQHKSKYSEPEFDDEFDTDDIEFDEEDMIDEGFIRRLQQRAGIIK